MKKRVFIGLMLIMMSFALSACKAGGKTKDDSESGSVYDKDGDGYLDGWY